MGQPTCPRISKRFSRAILYDWVRSHVPESAQAVFIGGNGFRAVGVIKALEETLGRPVLTANQVALWQSLVLSSSSVPIVGYGQNLALDELRHGRDTLSALGPLSAFAAPRLTRQVFEGLLPCQHRCPHASS